MKVGLLVIATHKYKSFFDNLYKSVDKYFLPNAEKIIFYYNDSNDDLTKKYKNVVDIKVRHIQWPGMTLFRYNFFCQKRKEILESGIEYIYYIDVDMVIVNAVNEAILPIGTKTLLGVFHPGYYNQKKEKPHESNIKSSFYVPPAKRVIYICGGFQGGKVNAYLDAAKEISEKITRDYNKNIIPIWHDESAFNHYFTVHSNKFKLLNPEYCYPDGPEIRLQNLYKQCIGLTPRIKTIQKDHKNYQI